MVERIISIRMKAFRRVGTRITVYLLKQEQTPMVN